MSKKIKEENLFSYNPTPMFNPNQTRESIVFRCLLHHPETLVDDTVLKYYIIVESGIVPPDQVTYDMLTFGNRMFLERLGFYNDATIGRARRKCVERYPFLFGPHISKSQRNKIIKEYEEGCMEYIPQGFIKPIKSFLSYPESTVENIMRIMEYLNKY